MHSWSVTRSIIKQEREGGLCVWEGRVAVLNTVAKEGLKKKMILERKKRGNYVDIWSRAIQKLGTTYTVAPWDRVTSVAEVECTRFVRQYQSRS